MMMEFNRIDKVNGILHLPGDKSISHRSVMFASMAEGKSEIHNCLMSDDVRRTINAFQAMGCNIDQHEEKMVITGKGIAKLEKPFENLYLGNSGTTARLITGILAAQNFHVTLTGDESLSSRPMKRIIDPLTEMGAIIESNDGFLPMDIYPADGLKPIEYRLPVASAQVKSAILLAGLHLDKETTVVEDKKSRDHTERMLDLRIVEEEGMRKIYSSKKDYPQNNKFIVPSDISTASFFIVLSLLLPNSELILKGISLNESRIGIIEVLRDMGGNITVDNLQTLNGEPQGDIIVKSSKLNNIDIPTELIPNIIDEIPILSIAGIFAEGKFVVKNAGELRHKESDRIKSVVQNLRLVGMDADEFEDGFSIHGSPNNDLVTFESYDDHRIAMSFSVLSSLLPQGGRINNFECVNISNPDFLSQLKQII